MPNTTASHAYRAKALTAFCSLIAITCALLPEATNASEVDEQAQAAMQADRARKADATREARYEKAEVKRVERAPRQRSLMCI